MIYIILADGFEETEAVAPVDILRRGGAEVKYAGLKSLECVGAHNITIMADMLLSDVKPTKDDIIAVPGGMGGVGNIEASKLAGEKLTAVYNAGGRVAAICAGPRALGKLGLLNGTDAVCYPGMEDQIIGANMKPECTVVVTERAITSRGPATAYDFGYALLEAVKGKDAADAVAKAMCYVR